MAVDDGDSGGWSSTTDVDTSRRGVATFGPPREPGGGLRSFTRRYGWRAYALPIMVLVTVLALMTARNATPKHRAAATAPTTAPTATAPTTATAKTAKTAKTAATKPAVAPAPPTASGNISLKSDVPSANSLNTPLPADALPAGASYTLTGKGTFRVLKGTSKVVGHGPLFRYDIEVENGVTGVDLTAFAAQVQSVLSDPRSWSGHGVSLERVDSGPIDFHVGLTSAMTVRKLCGYDIPIETSCYAPAGSAAGLDVNRVVFDVARWVRGDPAYVGDLDAYHVYMINHEDGHALGHEHAHECLADGLAPVMMQQTFGLKSAATGKLCQANPWPYPPGATDAPGAEQPDTKKNDEYYLINS